LFSGPFNLLIFLSTIIKNIQKNYNHKHKQTTNQLHSQTPQHNIHNNSPNNIIKKIKKEMQPTDDAPDSTLKIAADNKENIPL